MHYHRVYGVVAPERGWVPSPRYLLRRDRVRAHLAAFTPGTLLEIGCGAGALIHELARDGFSCTALDSSPAARELATYVNSETSDVEIISTPRNDNGALDYVLALEVLEHIAEDEQALRQWGQWLKPGGRLVLSVPAHPQGWNATDEWAGHVRRYSKEQLTAVLIRTGFEPERVECYGFPLANILEHVRAAYLSRQMRAGGQNETDPAAQTAQSGVDRHLESRFYPLYAGWLGTTFMRACFLAQRLFVQTELGNGLVVVARRK